MTAKFINELLLATKTLSFEDKGKYIALLGLISKNEATIENVNNTLKLSQELSNLLEFKDGFVSIKKTKKETGIDTLEFIKQSIDYLNSKTGANFKTTTNTTIKLLTGIRDEGYTIADIKLVIDNKCKRWLNTKDDIYLRPETLFGSKFDSYLNESKLRKQTTIVTSKASSPFGELSNRTNIR